MLSRLEVSFRDVAADSKGAVFSKRKQKNKKERSIRGVDRPQPSSRYRVNRSLYPHTRAGCADIA